MTLISLNIFTGCEEINIELCKNIGYSMTCFPNFFGHHTQAFAKKKFYDVAYLLECSPYIKEYLCSIYVPKCHPSRGPHLPCYSFTNYVSSKKSPECKDFDIPGRRQLYFMQFNLPPSDSFCYAPQIHGELY